jgi:elongation factor Tu
MGWKSERGTVTVAMPVTLMTARHGNVASEVTGAELFRRRLQSATAGDNVGLMVSGVRRSNLTRGDTIVG